MVQQGERVEFSCGSNKNESIDWRFRPSATQTEISIVKSGRFVIRFKDKIKSSKNGAYKLIINSASMNDGGTYTCIDEMGFGEAASAELTVLGNFDRFSKQYSRYIIVDQPI